MKTMYFIFYFVFVFVLLPNQIYCQTENGFEFACNSYCRQGIQSVLNCCERQRTRSIASYKAQAGYELSAKCDTNGQASCYATPKCIPGCNTCTGCRDQETSQQDSQRGICQGSCKNGINAVLNCCRINIPKHMFGNSGPTSIEAECTTGGEAVCHWENRGTRCSTQRGELVCVA